MSALVAVAGCVPRLHRAGCSDARGALPVTMDDLLTGSRSACCAVIRDDVRVAALAIFAAGDAA